MKLLLALLSAMPFFLTANAVCMDYVGVKRLSNSKRVIGETRVEIGPVTVDLKSSNGMVKIQSTSPVNYCLYSATAKNKTYGQQANNNNGIGLRVQPKDILLVGNIAKEDCGHWKLGGAGADFVDIVLDMNDVHVGIIFGA